MLSFLTAHWWAHRWLLATSGIGLLVVALLLAGSTPFLSTARETGLRYEIQRRTVENLDVMLLVPFRPLDERVYSRLQETVGAHVPETLGWATHGVVRYGNTLEMFLLTPGAPDEIGPTTPRATVQFLEGVRQHSRILEGRWWQPGDGTDSQGAVEVVIGPEAASLLGLQIGDRVVVIPDERDPRRRATLSLVGIAEPEDPLEEYWLAFDRFGPRVPGGFSPPSIPFLASEAATFQTLGRDLAPVTATYWWFLYIDRNSLTVQSIDRASTGLQDLENGVSNTFPRTAALTVLDQVVARHEARMLFTSAPLRLLLALTLASALLFLLLLGTTLAERQRRQTALLRSRGASVVHVLLPVATVGSLLAAIYLIASPILATLATGTVASSGLRGLANMGPSLSLPPASAYLLALAGLFTATVAWLVPLTLDARITGVQLREALSRPGHAPLPLRLYLDVFLLAVGIVLWIELSRSQGGITRAVLGTPAQNPLLALAPVLLLVGASLLLVRMLPLVARAVGSILSPVLPSWASLGLWMLSRRPASLLRLSLLLTVTASGAALAASLLPTLATAIGDTTPAASLQGTSLQTATLQAASATRQDPMLAATLATLSRITLASLAVLAGVGAILVAQALLQERFVEVGVLQAIGMGPQQLWRWLVLEHALAGVVSLAAGIWGGRQMAVRLLPLLDTGVRNPFVAPVTQVETEWGLVAAFTLVVAAALVAPSLLGLAAVRRRALEMGLRLGEEG